MRGSVDVLNAKASRQALPAGLSNELSVLLRWSTHRVDKARDIALGYLNRLISSFPSLMCSPSLVFAILEVLTLLRKACENEHYDEVRVIFPCRLVLFWIDCAQFNPAYEFHSERVDITLRLVDNYEVRNEILALLQRRSTAWFDAALTRAPTELQATLQVKAEYKGRSRLLLREFTTEISGGHSGDFFERGN